MLFPYTYVPHKMEKMQEFIDFIFFEVWCKAPIGLVFHPDLFLANSELKEVMTEFGFAAKAAERGKSFYKDVKAIYELFFSLPSTDIDQFKQWYKDNNDLERVCANDPAVNPARYKDVVAKHPILGKRLASFFRDLYDNSFLGLSVIKGKIGDIKDHNKQFFEKNTTGKCPFCGISDLKGIYHTRREAYDHYLPKYRYPFNSINFRNLAPACSECNSAYKLSKDPAHNPAGRRKAFYPYAPANHAIELTISLGASDVDRLTASDIQIAFGPAAVREEIATWIDVYGIDERYKAKCCSGDAKDWLEQIRILSDAYGVTPEASLAVLQQQTVKDPVANSNFLKQAFLEGCQRAGLLAKFPVQKSHHD